MNEESKISEFPINLQKKYSQCDCSSCEKTREVGTYEKEYKRDSPCRKELLYRKALLQEHLNVMDNIEDIMHGDMFDRFIYFILYSITLVAILLLAPMLFLI